MYLSWAAALPCWHQLYPACRSWGVMWLEWWQMQTHIPRFMRAACGLHIAWIGAHVLANGHLLIGEPSTADRTLGFRARTCRWEGQLHTHIRVQGSSLSTMHGQLPSGRPLLCACLKDLEYWV